MARGGAAKPIEDHDPVHAFECPSHPDLERFFRLYALSNHRQGYSVTFVLRGQIAGNPAVLGYYSLSAIIFNKAQAGQRWNDGPRELPAVLIGRLAVDHRAHPFTIQRRRADAAHREQPVA